jgi:hypothetical protein
MEEILIHLGKGWIPGVDDLKRRVKKRAILDSRIKIISKLRPFEFDRQIETTEFMRMGTWKATTYRQFFLYVAYPLLEDLLDSDWLELVRYLQYFMYLIGGADPNPVPEHDLVLAQKIIEYWVTKFVHMTNGRCASKPSTHFALHIVQDCRFHGCHYDVLSAFKYENELRYIIGDINSGNCKLEQLKNRMLEREKYVLNRHTDGRIKRDPSGKLSMGRDAEILNSTCQETDSPFLFRSNKDKQCIKLAEVQVSNALRDSFALVNESSNLREPQIMRIVEFNKRRIDQSLEAVGILYHRKSSLFQTPGDSKSKHVYVFSKPNPDVGAVPVANIVGKVYAIPRFSKFGLKIATWDMLGKDFSKVDEWVGVALRHVLADQCSLY